MKHSFVILMMLIGGVCQGQYYGMFVPNVGVGPPSYDTDFQAVLDEGSLNGWTAPNTAQQDLLNDMVVGLKADGIWSKLDYFALFEHTGAQDFNRINWLNPTGSSGSIIGSPVWSTSDGYTSTDASNYFDTNYAMSDGPNNSQTSVTFGFYVDNIQWTDNSSFLGGAVNGSNNGSAFRMRSGTSEQFGANTVGNVYEMGTSARGETTFTLTQTSGDLEFFVGGSLEHDFLSTTTLTPLSLDIYVGIVNFNGTAFGSNNSGDFHIKCMFVGEHLTNAEVSDLHSRLNTYFQNN
jgi:hypothetical protein